MHALEQMFPSLTLFSDLNWDAVTREYESHYIDISFPEYLQQKAMEGDCPPYLFELAFFELALFDVRNSQTPFPYTSGLYLNPTALFLNLEFDVRAMLDHASQGKIEILERDHILCLFRDQNDSVQVLELDEDHLLLLQNFEAENELSEEVLSNDQRGSFGRFKERGLIIEIP
jgi:hypothetical protein